MPYFEAVTEYGPKMSIGKGSQKHAFAAIACEPNPLDDPAKGKKDRRCGFFKMKVLMDVTKESVDTGINSVYGYIAY